MPRIAAQITCSPETQNALKELAASRTAARQDVERARIILGCLSGKPVQPKLGS